MKARMIFHIYFMIQNTITTAIIITAQVFFSLCECVCAILSCCLVRILYFREYIVTWFLKCILRFWIHGRYSSSSSNTNNSNGTTTGKDEKKNCVNATKQMDRKEKESIAKGDENTKREKKHTPYNTVRQ